VKASAGGGGRGIRFVEDESGLEAAFASSKQDALTFFGNGDVYIEKFVINPKHIEIQLLADEHGNTIHLGERDCSTQRRNQKLIEESPSPVVDEALRQKIGMAAVKVAKSCGYANAGTIEFLLGEDGNFYFMEMNARIQVEHPVTEIVTGIDLIKAQIRIAAGEKLPWTQDDIKMSGHVIECRINAEDSANNFRPSPGKIAHLHFPGGLGVRIDSAMYQGYTIPPYYDSMIAKVIVRGDDRPEAIQKMRVALAEFLLDGDGVCANIDFQLDILNDKTFLEGKYDIGFLTRKLSKS
jgi:acetyl-CoA carboxylase biotin carboxylase subunit